MNKNIKRKLLAGLCAISSIGSIAKPAIDTSTYAVMDEETLIISDLPEIYAKVLENLTLKFVDDGKKIGKGSALLDYDEAAASKSKIDLCKYINDEYIAEFNKELAKNNTIDKNSILFKKLIEELNGPGIYDPGLPPLSGETKFKLKEYINKYVESLWKMSWIGTYQNALDRKSEVHNCAGTTTDRALYTALNKYLKGNSYYLRKNAGMYAGGIIGGVGALSAAIAMVTFVPGMATRLGGEAAASWLQNRSQNKERKRNMNRGAGNVLRLNKVNLDAVRSSFNSIASMYPYSYTNAKQFTNALYANLLKKIKDPSSKAGMILAYGPPGSGKTNLVRECIKAIYKSTNKGTQPLILSQSMIDEFDKVNSPTNQAWGVTKKDVAGRTISSLSPFASAVMQANKQKDGLVFVLVDDADKFKEDVLRGLWDATDGGTILVDGQEISLSKVVFIMTANSDMSNKMATFGGTGAAAAASAFSSRCLKFGINAPGAKDYALKLREMFERLGAEYGNFSISDKTVNILAKRCVEAQKGMRAVNEIETVTRGILSSGEYNPSFEIVPVNDGEDGWLKQLDPAQDV